MVVMYCEANAQVLNYNFPDRKALIVNICPDVELSRFSFENRPEAGDIRFHQDISWTNIGTQPLVAFQIVILKYDVFDQPMLGRRWTVTGSIWRNWKPLKPGESSSDGTTRTEDKVFTEIAFVRLARTKDGTIWKANDKALLEQLRKVANIQEIGDIETNTTQK